MRPCVAVRRKGMRIKRGAGKPDCAAVPGTTILTIAVRRTATTTSGSATTSTTISAFGWFVALAVLFSTRAGGWEFTGSVLEESRPVPAMLATVSKNPIELGSLVSGDTEEFLNSTLNRSAIAGKPISEKRYEGRIPEEQYDSDVWGVQRSFCLS